MSYNPGVTDRSGEIFASFLNQGINNLAKSATDAIAQYHADKDENDFLGSTFEGLVQDRTKRGQPVDSGQIEKFHSGSLSAKRGIVSSLASQAYRDQQDLQTQALKQKVAAGQMDLDNARTYRSALEQFNQQYGTSVGGTDAPAGPHSSGKASLGGLGPNEPAPLNPDMLNQLTGYGATSVLNNPRVDPDLRRKLLETREGPDLSGLKYPAHLMGDLPAGAPIRPQAQGALWSTINPAAQPEGRTVPPTGEATARLMAHFGLMGTPQGSAIASTLHGLSEVDAESARAGNANQPNVIEKNEIFPGVSAVSLRGGKGFQIATDPKLTMQTEQVPDANGVMHTIIRNPKTGAAVFVPAGNPAQAQKLGVDSLVAAEKAVREIDDDISAWQSQLRRSQTDKKVASPDPARLQDLQQRRARLMSAGSGGQGKASSPAADKLRADADAAIQAGADPAKVKARLEDKLKELEE